MPQEEAANQPTLAESFDALAAKAGDDALEAAETSDSLMKTGGGLNSEELAAAEQARPANQDEPATKEATASPPSEKVFGKYENLTEAEKGYFEAANSLSAEKQRTQELTNQILEMQSQQLQQPQRVNPAERAAERDYNKELADLGVDPGIVNGLVRQGVVQETQKLLGPMLSQAQAEQNLIDNDESYSTKVSGRLNKFIAGNPAVRARIDAADAAAIISGQAPIGREWALIQMRKVEGDVVETAQSANNTVREEIVSEQVKQAAPVKKVSSQGREIDTKPKDDDKYISREELDRLNNLAKMGHSGPLLQRTISDTLPSELF